MRVPFVITDVIDMYSTGALEKVRAALEQAGVEGAAGAAVRNMIRQEAWCRSGVPQKYPEMEVELGLGLARIALTGENLTFATRGQLLALWLVAEQEPWKIVAAMWAEVMRELAWREECLEGAVVVRGGEDETAGLEDYTPVKYRSIDRKGRNRVQGKSCRFAKKVAARRWRASWKAWVKTLNPRCFNRSLGGERF